MNTRSNIWQSREKNSWHYLQAMQGETVRKASRVVLSATLAIAGLVAGFMAAYYVLSSAWTHLFVRPEQVVVRDIYAALALSVIAGLIAAALILRFTTRFYRTPPTRAFRSDLDRHSKRPALTL
jgi:hypothetical protein